MPDLSKLTQKPKPHLKATIPNPFFEAPPTQEQTEEDELIHQQQIEALRERFQLLALKNGDSPLASFFSSIPDEEITKWYNDLYVNALLTNSEASLVQFLSGIQNEFEDPDFLRRFQTIVLDGDRDALIKKSEVQRSQLAALYFPPGLTDAEISLRKKKIEAFEGMIKESWIIRSDPNKYDTYKPPLQTGNYSSFGLRDALVQAHRYVYASLDLFPHYMASDYLNWIHFDRKEIMNRAELVMIDIAYLSSREEGRVAEHYLNNLFDLETGQDILALYLAYVFDDESKAEDFLRRFNHMGIKVWDTDLWRSKIMEIQELDSGPPQFSEEDVRTIQEKMINVFELIDMEPPLSIEVRIRGEATAYTAPSPSTM